MKQRNNILYWTAKIFISSFILLSAYLTYTQPEGIKKLGFPDYFRIELVAAKTIGAIALLLPVTSVRIKEWAYAGFIISMSSGLIAHIYTHDPPSKIVFVSADLILVLICIRYVSKKDLIKDPLIK